MEWKTTSAITPYKQAMTLMEARQHAVQQGTAEELIWLLEHPPLYTAGRSARAQDLLASKGFEVHEVGRGGQYTYHGPGQRVGYLVLDLATRGKDVRAYVQQLEQWIIDSLGALGVESFTREGRIGVWAETPKGEAKIAALGVRVQKWVTTHGIAINVNPDLSHYGGIVPCGISEFGVTSLADLGNTADTAALDAALAEHCPFTR